MLKSQFQGKKVLVTGHSGFKGSWMAFTLASLGAKVYGFSISTPEDKRHSYYELGIDKTVENIETQWGDIRRIADLNLLFEGQEFDYVFHLAAQALVADAYMEPLNTFETNALGTVNVLETLRVRQFVGTVVMITSDKAYKNDDQGIAFVETDELGGYDPYSSSKGMAELAIRSYASSYESFQVGGIGSTRAGNVFGGGDWSKNRLIPDIVRDVLSDRRIALRKPTATRPWTHVLDVIHGYLLLAVHLKLKKVNSGEAWNFASGETKTVLEIAQTVSTAFASHHEIEFGAMDEISEPLLLQISAEKSFIHLGWKPQMTVDEWLGLTMEWYVKQSNQEDLRGMSLRQVSRVFQL